MTTTAPHGATPTPAWRRWPFAGVSVGRIGAGTLNALLGIPISVAAVTALAILSTLTVSLAILYPLALVLLALWIIVSRTLAVCDRWRVGTLLGLQIPAPEPFRPQGSWHARLWAHALHRDVWRAFAYQLVRFPLAIAAFSGVVLAWALPLFLLLVPLALVGAEAERITYLAVAGPTVAFFLGLAVLPLCAKLIEAFSVLDAAIAYSLLGPSNVDKLDRRVAQLRTTRQDLVDVAEQERRRIERDLHDGAGQQLVSLAMTLGMAREKMGSDPDRAQALIDEAHAEAKHALVGLRNTVRGISPAVLADRGLGAALASVANRAAVPVNLHVDVPVRPDEVTEGIAYYVACEGINNAQRHARPSTVNVTVASSGDELQVEVSDDGGGGADPARGTGLRGLHGRVAAVDGMFTVDSPAGGPTTIRATLPMHASGHGRIGGHQGGDR